MNTKLVEDIASAVLYEGYLLYPYRASSIKNRQRWNFGVLYPRAYAEQQSGADAWQSQTECLVRGGAGAKLSVRVRFLQLVPSLTCGAIADGNMGAASHCMVAPHVSEGTARASERDIALHSLRLSELASHSSALMIKQPAEVLIEVQAEAVETGLFKLRINIINSAEFSGSTRDEALAKSLLSTHTILGIEGGEFVSLLDPPEELRDVVATCNNSGTWPVLVGEEGQRDAMLSSPIILYDYPQIAPESPGALFDGTEMTRSSPCAS
jgi:hypothetical protein